MADGIKRRRLRWSLRTMFVVVTVLGCWLGYEVNWIRQRHALLAEVERMFELFPGTLEAKCPIVKMNRVNAPGLLGLLGEEGVQSFPLIIVCESFELLDSRPQLRHAESLFPEAKITAIPCRKKIFGLVQRLRRDRLELSEQATSTY